MSAGAPDASAIVSRSPPEFEGPDRRRFNKRPSRFGLVSGESLFGQINANHPPGASKVGLPSLVERARQLLGV